MHRAHLVLLESTSTAAQREAQNSGRSIGELVREAIDGKVPPRPRERMWAALEASRGA